MTSSADHSPTHQELAGDTWNAIRTLMFDQFILYRHDRRRRVHETLGLPFIRVAALVHLLRQPERALTMSQLAARLECDAPYATVIVKDLESRHLVTKTARADDRRHKLVELTPAGAEMAAAANRILSEPPQPMYQLDDTELRQLNHIVTKLLQTTEEFAPEPG
jgi:DNA-binding MarR family transcriptional regulator